MSAQSDVSWCFSLLQTDIHIQNIYYERLKSVNSPFSFSYQREWTPASWRLVQWCGRWIGGPGTSAGLQLQHQQIWSKTHQAILNASYVKNVMFRMAPTIYLLVKYLLFWGLGRLIVEAQTAQLQHLQCNSQPCISFFFFFFISCWNKKEIMSKSEEKSIFLIKVVHNTE